MGPHEREPTASDVVKALETAMLQFEKQDVDSVKLMQLTNFMSFAKGAEINGCMVWYGIVEFNVPLDTV